MITKFAFRDGGFFFFLPSSFFLLSFSLLSFRAALENFENWSNWRIES